MTGASRDLVILGSGTTALAAALRAVALGARVRVVEQSHLGGTCVNWGCIPSKTLIHKAELYFGARRGERYGLNLSAGTVACGVLMAAKEEAVATLRRGHFQQVFDAHPEIEVVRGHGRFISPRELRVGAEILVGERFLIACGGVPRVPRLPGLAGVDYLTSYSALHLPCYPESLVILGGGVIALEMGQMFRRFGSRVTILERGDRPLKEFDPRLTALLSECLEEEGVEIVYGVEAERVTSEADGIGVVARVGGRERVFRGKRLMLAVGTAPATADIGLEAAGVETGPGGFVRVDDELRTSAPGIWAAGDVTGPPLIAPAGAREGELAAENMLVPDAHRCIDHRHTPMAVFVDPEIACVGISAADAASIGIEAVDTFLDLEDVAKAHVMGQRKGGFVLCSEAQTGRILGAQVVAPRAADVIHEAALAVRCGLTVADLAAAVHVYPTISDGWRLAALRALGR